MDSCVQQLKAGCRYLDLPNSTARELVRFLLVKRFVGDETGSRLSPSSKVDALWHWMLLETNVRDTVEALVGRVKHTQATEAHSDTDKMERRCA